MSLLRMRPGPTCASAQENVSDYSIATNQIGTRSVVKKNSNVRVQIPLWHSH